MPWAARAGSARTPERLGASLGRNLWVRRGRIENRRSDGRANSKKSREEG